MTHYYCHGSCGGVSKKPGACMDGDCELHGEPLAACDTPGCGHKA